MSASSLLLGIFLICVGIGHFGVAVPGILLGIIALLAGIAVLVAPLFPGSRV